MTSCQLSINKQKISKFPDGQMIVHMPEKIAGDHVILHYEWDWNTYQCLVGATKSLQNRGIKTSLYLPYMFGMRADRKFAENDCNYFRDVIAPCINGLNFEQVYTVDTHSDVVEACIPNVRIANNSFLVNKTVSDLKRLNKKLCLVIPDAGATKRAKHIQSSFDFTLQFYKTRNDAGNVTNLYCPDLDNLDRSICHDTIFVVVDDICDGGATFHQLKHKLNEKFAAYSTCVLVVTHGLFSRGTKELLRDFDRIYTTNSVHREDLGLNVFVYDVWKLFDYGIQIFK